MSQPSGQNQQNGKRIYLNFSSSLYIAPWLQKNVTFMVLRFLKKAFVSQKIESVHFYLCPQAKIYPRFLSLPLDAGGNFPFPSHNDFSQQKGRKIMKLKKLPKLNLQGLVTSLDKFHHLSNHNIFSFCSVVP